jgi:type IX secretion system PorP/SprF family membrane protein
MVRYSKIIQVFLVFFLIHGSVVSQDIESQMIYSVPILGNPALTGSEGIGKLRLVYRDYYPGHDFHLGSVFASYDTYNESLHGGIGFYISDNKLGDLMNEMRTGASYSYHLRASEDLYINAGFLASVIHRGFKSGSLILPDEIDPLLGPILTSSELIDIRSGTIFDMNVGFLFSYLNYHAGLSVSHITTPGLTGAGKKDSRMARRYTIHASGSFRVLENELSLDPVFYFSLQDNLYSLSAGLSGSYKVISLNVLSHTYLQQGLGAIQTGIHIKMGTVGLAYNYLFNPFKTGPFIPSTLSNQISLIISLNNVEKRGVIKAINFPKL